VANLRWGATAAIFALIVSVFLGILFSVSIFHILVRAAIFTVVFFALGFGLKFLIDGFFPELLFTDDEPVLEIDQTGSRIDITVDSTGEYAVPELYKANDSEELGNIEDLISGAFKPRAASETVKIDEKKAVNNWFDTPLAEEPIDRTKKEDYNELEDVQSIFEDTPPITAAAEMAQFSPSFGDESGLGGLPDLDMMAKAFSFGGDSRPAPSWPGPAEAAVKSSPTASSAQSAAQPAPVVSAPSFVPSIPVFENVVEEQPRYVGNKPQPLEGDFDPKDLAKGISTILNKS